MCALALILKDYTVIHFTPRLSRLLHKHKFTEAENFAIQFGLDVEVSCPFLINAFRD